MAGVPVYGRIVGPGRGILLSADSSGTITSSIAVPTNGAADVQGFIEGAGTHILATWQSGSLSYSKGVGLPPSDGLAPIVGRIEGRGQYIDVTWAAGAGSPSVSVRGGSAIDTTPDQFTFTDVTDADLSTVYESNTITVTGIAASASVSITGGDYSKNGGGYTSSPGTASAGDTFKVRVTSSGSFSTAVNATLTIGGVSDTYTVTTEADAGGFPDSAFAAAGGYFRIEADNPANNAVAIAQTFTSANVNTTTNTVALADQDFGAFGTYAGAKATRGWFSTTGTLPACSNATLVAGTASAPGTIVYRVDDGAGNATFYKAADDSEWASIPAAISTEVVRRAQRYAQAVDPLDFTNGGTGTHTFRTWPLTQTMAAMAGAHNATALTADPHAFFEIATDSEGRAFVFQEKIVTDPEIGNYRGYGKTYPFGPDDEDMKTELVGKHWLWMLVITRPNAERERVYPKITITGGVGVDTSANTITDANLTITGTDQFTTGEAVRFIAHPGGTLPSPFVAGTDYFPRNAVADDVITLHPTSADAIANTNTIDITTTGTGFTIFATTRSGDSPRWTFHAEVARPDALDGNAISPRNGQEGGSVAVSTFATAGAANGEITGIPMDPRPYEGAKMYLWVPQGTVMPTATDTGVPLASGNFWISYDPVNDDPRLHRSEVSALRSIGVATSASDCIKYSAGGSGSCNIAFDDDARSVSVAGIPAVPTNMLTRLPTDRPVIQLSMIDYNDSGSVGVRHSVGVNEPDTEAVDMGVSGNKIAGFGAYVGGGAGTWLNSIASHVSESADIYATLIGAGTGARPNAALTTLIDYYKNKPLGFPDIPAPVNTVLPTVSNDPTVGNAMTLTHGTWTGSKPITYAFQMQRADDASGTNTADISGATNLRYTPQAADDGKFLRLRVTATNFGGATQAFSAWSNVAVETGADAELAALLAEMDVQPSSQRADNIEALIVALKNAGVWQKLSLFYMFKAHDEQAARLNWVAPTTFELVNIGTPTFTVDDGFDGDGTSAGLDTVWDPATNGGGIYTQNSAHIGVQPAENTTANPDCGNTRATIGCRSPGGAYQVFLNATAGTLTASGITDALGHHVANRNSSSTIDFWKAGTKIVSGHAQASAALQTEDIYVLARNVASDTFSSRKLRVFHMGAGLTDTEVQDFTAALTAYSDAVDAEP